MTAAHQLDGASRARTRGLWLAGANLRTWIVALALPPRRALARQALFPPGRLAVAACVTILAVATIMLAIDSWAVGQRTALPGWAMTVAAFLGEAGKSGWLLVPAALALVGVAAVATPTGGRMAYGVLIALAVRIGFVFLAVGVPGLFIAIVKRLIGRARPNRIEGADIYFAPFSWSPDLASFPSGHSTTAFAMAVALGALFPRLRVPLFVLAAAIALSRIAAGAHYPSDIVAGAVVGSFGALLVRGWFAARGRGFGFAADGSVRAFRGPPLRRIWAALGQRSS